MSARLNLGTPEEWGLTPEKHRELCAELEDHLECLRERGDQTGTEGGALAESAAARLREPQSRRRLTAAHLADQVYATLHRKPSRQEWRELGWLLFWFALIVASDVLAVASNDALRAVDNPVSRVALSTWLPRQATPAVEAIAIWAWLLMSVARAGFYASFAHSLHRAVQTGWGVCLARVVQLKLIHTVLVVLAMLCIGSMIEKFAWGGWYAELWSGSLPVWLNGVSICLGLVVVSVLLWTVRPRLWHFGLGGVIAAMFLYPGSPLGWAVYQLREPIARPRVQLSTGARLDARWATREHLREIDADIIRIIEPESDLVSKEARGLRRRMALAAEKGLQSDIVSIDEESNTFVARASGVPSLPWHILSTEQRNYTIGAKKNLAGMNYFEAKLDTAIESRLTLPQTVPGGGVGWLAAPIPLLTLVGLLGLLGLMGRRGPIDFLLYFILAGLALGTTLMPFFVGQPASHLMELSPLAVMHTPFPGFEMLMVSPMKVIEYSGLMDALMGSTLILGLLLSAALPWLMTALFLKPRRGPDLPPEQAEA